MNAHVVRRRDSRQFMLGQEDCREYVKTEKVTFGTSTLLPQQEGDIDHGHPNSQEVFFVSQGRVIVRLGSQGEKLEMQEGDALLVPENVAHQVSNIGNTPAIIVWSLSPSE